MNRPTTLYLPFTAQGTPTDLSSRGFPLYLRSQKPSCHPQTFVAQWQGPLPATQRPGPTSRRHVKRWFRARVSASHQASQIFDDGRSEVELDTHMAELVGTLTAVEPQAESRRRLDELVNLWPATRMNELIPWLLGGGRSRGQETRSLRPRQKIQPAALWAQTAAFNVVIQLVLASP